MSLSFSPSQASKLAYVASSVARSYDEIRDALKIPVGVLLSNGDAAKAADFVFSAEPDYDRQYVAGHFAAILAFEEFQTAFTGYLEKKVKLSDARKAHRKVLILLESAEW